MVSRLFRASLGDLVGKPFVSGFPIGFVCNVPSILGFPTIYVENVIVFLVFQRALDVSQSFQWVFPKNKQKQSSFPRIPRLREIAPRTGFLTRRTGFLARDCARLRGGSVEFFGFLVFLSGLKNKNFQLFPTVFARLLGKLLWILVIELDHGHAQVNLHVVHGTHCVGD